MKQKDGHPGPRGRAEHRTERMQDVVQGDLADKEARDSSSRALATARFDYHLPPELIAQRPDPQQASRLLVLPASGAATHEVFTALPKFLRRGDLLVYNDTKVVRARLFATKVLAPESERNAGEQSPAQIEILLLERRAERIWSAMLRPARRLRRGGRLQLRRTLRAAALPANGPTHHRGSATVEPEQNPPEVIVERRQDDEFFTLTFDRPLEPLLQHYGHLPLPPYIERAADRHDDLDYQTIFARRPGAVAAPTAGLHFGPELLSQLEERGVRRTAITLHVGPGTFRPITSENALEHPMHSEWYDIPQETVDALARVRAEGGRVVAVGTTVVRTLEAAAQESVAADHDHLSPANFAAGSGRTAIYITPGFRFRLVDAMVTNFHLPRSTLLLLVSAFAGSERIATAYSEAIAQRYRFYSYGDAMLLERSSD